MTATGRLSTRPAAASFFLPSGPLPRLWAPMLVAFVVEALILAVILFSVAHHPQRAVSPEFGPIRLDLTKLPTPDAAATAPRPSAAAERAAPAKPAPKQAARQHKPAETTPDASSAPSSGSPPPQTAPNNSSSSSLSLSPPADAAAAGPPQPAPPKANGQTIDVSEFMRQVNAALHKAAHNINMLRGIKLIGRVTIVVHYRDGKAWDPRIVKTSGFPMLDQSVAEAAAQAEWPPPPPGLEGRELVIPVAGVFW